MCKGLEIVTSDGLGYWPKCTALGLVIESSKESCNL